MVNIRIHAFASPISTVRRFIDVSAALLDEVRMVGASMWKRREPWVRSS